MLSYARVVCLLNEKRQQPGGHPFGVVTTLQEAQEEISPNPAHDQVVGCWDLLRCMVNEEQVVKGEFKHLVLRESHYQKAYQQQRCVDVCVVLCLRGLSRSCALL
jgi:hypothetical protein